LTGELKTNCVLIETILYGQVKIQQAIVDTTTM